MHAWCRIAMLGGLRVRQGDQEITRFSTQKTAVLLAYLAYHLPATHPREVLAETLWPGRSPKQGRVSLSAALSSLRRQLEPPGVPRGAIIQGDRFSVRLNPAAISTDVGDFHSVLRQAAGADSTAGRLQHLHDAVALYAGELLPGFYEDWVLVEQRKLADGYFEAALSLTTLLEQTGDIERAIEVAHAALSHDPLREEAHGELMRLHAASGQPVAALRQYAELKKLLAEELGQAPSATTERLARTIRAATPRVPDARPPCRPDVAPRRTLLPTGTVTLLLTDVEGATALSEKMGQAFGQVLDSHHALLRRAFRRHDAEEIREAGASFTVAFPTATDAAECAVACQRALAAHRWPREIGALRVRMAVYTGDVRAEGGACRDMVLHRASRVLSAAHGGQILCSEATAALLKRDLTVDIRLEDLGTYRLRGVTIPEKVFQVDYPGMSEREFPPPLAEAAYAGSLPLQLTRFFGREEELEELRALLVDEREQLVTLTGPGGSGKTRLALEAARRLMGDFGGAVWFVGLSPLSDVRLIPGAIADALSLPRSPHVEPLERVATVLGEQSPLLILDGLEHFGAEVGPVVHQLLDRVRSATCLATSRHRLDLPGEREYLVPPLPVPQEGEPLASMSECASVQLYVDRAQSAKPDFQLTEANAQPIAALCDRLDGIPLALELAAARIQVLTTREMVAQLEHRYDFLVSRRRVTEERHRTLRAAMEWSFRLLEPELRRLFCALSVFRGGWTLEAAEAVCEEPKAMDNLEQLRDWSLIQTVETDLGIRFRMLRTLREFGREQPTEDQLAYLRRRHASYFAELAEARDDSDPDAYNQWLARCDEEHDNLRHALAWSGAEGCDRELHVRLCAALAPFWQVRGHWSEARGALDLALTGTPADAGQTGALPLRAKALDIASELARAQADLPAAHAYLEQALTVRQELGDEIGMTQSLFRLALVAMDEQDFGSAGKSLERAYRICRQVGAGAETAQCLMLLGWLALNQGDPSRATELTHQSLTIRRKLGGSPLEVDCLQRLGAIAHDQTDYDDAQRWYQKAIDRAREIGHTLGVTRGLNALGSLSRKQQRYAQARKLHEEALAIHEEAGDTQGIAGTLDCLGQVAFDLADYGTAEALHQKAVAIYRELGFPRGIGWSLHHLAAAALKRGDLVASCVAYREALTCMRDIRSPMGVAATLDGLAECARAEKALIRAARLLGAAEGLRGRALRPTAAHSFVSLKPDSTEVRAELGEDAFEAAWTEGQRMSLDDAVEYALSDDDQPPPRAAGSAVR